MQRIEMIAEVRESSGKGVARRIRQSGKIPGVLYGGGHSLLLTLDPADLVKILRSGAGENALIALKLSTGPGQASGSRKKAEERLTILRDFQLDPISGKLLHADLFEVSLNKTIRVRVHTEITGEVPLGVKEGGMLQHPLREIEVECLPTAIPDCLEVDASSLQIGEAIHVRDLRLGEGVRVLGQPDQVVVSVSAPISEAQLEEMLAGAPKEAKEPEVIARAKEGEEVKPEGESAAAGQKPKKEEG